MALWQWSTTPANNASAGAIDWAEGQPPSTVNDSARQMMADVATWYQTPEWLNYGLTPTYLSGTQFTLTGNQTAIYAVGRRVRTFNTSGTFYGTITSSTYTSVTTVTVSMDSGSLDSGLSEVDVGLINAANSSLAQLSGNLTVVGGNLQAGTSAFTGEAHLKMQNTNTYGYFFQAVSGTMGFFDNTRTLVRWQSDTAGNFSAANNVTAGGNITANSDERLKENWEGLSSDFIDMLARVRSGTYSRIDSGIRQTGVGAQSLQKVLPEAVIESEKGILSVAYGQAALVACVELAKEVVRLRALLEPVK